MAEMQTGGQRGGKCHMLVGGDGGGDKLA